MTSIEFVIQTDITLNIYYKILSIFKKNVVILNFGSHFGIIHNFNLIYHDCTMNTAIQRERFTMIHNSN